MFTGSSIHSLDVKGRLAIPAGFRDVLKAKRDDKLVVTTLPNSDHYLVCYPVEDWRALADKIANLPELNEDVQTIKRRFFGNANECTLDKQGRVLIPPRLRQKAALEGKAVLIGAQKYFEIWNEERWEEEEERISGTNIGARMAELGV